MWCDGQVTRIKSTSYPRSSSCSIKLNAVVYLPHKSRHASKQFHHSTQRVAPGPLSKLRNATTPLSKPRVAPEPLSMLSKFTTPLSIPRGLLFISTSHARPRHSPHLVMLQSSTLYPTPLRHPRHRQRYATTPLHNSTPSMMPSI
ncbi:hypothetical protein Pcinc_012859 [Petrolisthes cinctipes]|uniref:Uncharacterized protein n=1 Tax=Petrolisthes cinctipes TaxID=88211 RepID=A0AAE1G0B7_PETCI|nr:hypothetical protein Pcinc_012859 [Petrolisthes cinctipes]